MSDKTYNVLVVDDEIINVTLMKRLLVKAGFNVVTCDNGADALEVAKSNRFDCVITDWMMPQIDGIELIRRLRENSNPIPYIIMVTALFTESAKEYALESGADDFISKPIDATEFASKVTEGISKMENAQKKNNIIATTFSQQVEKTDTPAVCIATSTGGPPTLVEFLKNLNSDFPAPIFIIQHGPAWMLETLAARLDTELELKVKLAKDGEEIYPSVVYLAPGDFHLRVVEENRLALDKGAKENYVRPSADLLFVSVSQFYREKAIGISLTGLGVDGVVGAKTIVANGGMVFVQDPKTAVAAAMPEAVIKAELDPIIATVEEIANAVQKKVWELIKLP